MPTDCAHGCACGDLDFYHVGGGSTQLLNRLICGLIVSWRAGLHCGARQFHKLEGAVRRLRPASAMDSWRRPATTAARAFLYLAEPGRHHVRAARRRRHLGNARELQRRLPGRTRRPNSLRASGLSDRTQSWFADGRRRLARAGRRRSRKCAAHLAGSPDLRVRGVLIAGASDHHWLDPGQRFDMALCRTESLLVLRNDHDIVLTFYPLRETLLEAQLGRTRTESPRRLPARPVVVEGRRARRHAPDTNRTPIAALLRVPADRRRNFALRLLLGRGAASPARAPRRR